MKEEEQRGSGGELEFECVLLEDPDRSDRAGGRISGVGGVPVGDVLAGDCGHIAIEFDAHNFAEAVFAGDEQAAAFAAANIDEGVVGDGMGWNRRAPLVDEAAQDARRDAVVRGDVLIVDMTGHEVFRGHEPAGIHSVHLVERMDRECGELQQVAWTHRGSGDRCRIRICCFASGFG